MMDKHTKSIQGSPLVFADDMVLVNETRSGVSLKLEIWQDTLKSKDSQLSRTKQDTWNVSLAKLETEMKGL